jgi:hypothetical protein
MGLLILGESIKQDFTVISKSPVKSLTASDIITQQDSSVCCVDPLIALAEASFTNVFYNDSHSVSFDWNNNFVSAVMYLEKYVNGAWSPTILNSTAYGTLYSFGHYVTIYSENKIGYEITWALVLAGLGEGHYRVRCTGTTMTGATYNKYSLQFKLLTYTSDRANETVRIEWWLNGNVGDQTNDLIKKDYGTLNWYNQLRLSKSKFGFDETETAFEGVKYQDGKVVWLKKSDIEKYTLKTGLLDNDVRRYLLYDVLNGDEIRITDFNQINANDHVKRYVNYKGGFKVNYIDGNILASCEISLEQAYQNNEHKRQ